MHTSARWWWHFRSKARLDPEPDEIRDLMATPALSQIEYDWVLPPYTGTDAIDQVQTRWRPGTAAWRSSALAATATAYVLSAASLSGLTMDEVNGSFDFEARLRNEDGHESEWRRVTASLLPMRVQTLTGLTPPLGGTTLDISTLSYSGMTLADLQAQIRVDGETAWTDATIENWRANTGSHGGQQVGTFRITGLIPATAYDVRVRHVLRHNGAVWRAGAWSQGGPTSTADAASLTLTGARRAGASRRATISGTTNFSISSGDTDRLESQYSVDGGTTWHDVDHSAASIFPTSDPPFWFFDTVDLPLSGGTFSFRVRYNGGGLTTDWAVDPNTITLANIQPSLAYSITRVQDDRLMIVSGTYANIPDLTASASNWTAEVNTGDTGWVERNIASGASLSGTNGFSVNFPGPPTGYGPDGETRVRLRYDDGTTDTGWWEASNTHDFGASPPQLAFSSSTSGAFFVLTFLTAEVRLAGRSVRYSGSASDYDVEVAADGGDFAAVPFTVSAGGRGDETFATIRFTPPAGTSYVARYRGKYTDDEDTVVTGPWLTSAAVTA